MATKNFPSPRGKFMQTPQNIINHRKLIDSVELGTSIDVALQEYSRAIVALAGTQDLSGAGAQQAAAASFHMISGAYQFIEVFNRLAEPFSEPTKGNTIESLKPNN